MNTFPRTSWGHRSRWIARFAFLSLAAAALVSLRQGVEVVAYTLWLIGVSMLIFLSCDICRKTRRLGREQATLFTLRVALPSSIASTVIWLVIHG